MVDARSFYSERKEEYWMEVLFTKLMFPSRRMPVFTLIMQFIAKKKKKSL